MAITTCRLCSTSNSTNLQCVKFVFKLCLVVKELLVELLFILFQLFLRLLHLVHNTSRPRQRVPARNRDGERRTRGEKKMKRRREGGEEEAKEKMRRKKGRGEEEGREGSGRGGDFEAESANACMQLQAYAHVTHNPLSLSLTEG